MEHLVAVYGSLRKGLHNHVFLQGSEFVCEDWSPPRYNLLDLGAFPGLIEAKPDQNPISVKLEFYRVSDAVLAQLDALEGHPTFYERVKAINQDCFDEDYEFWIYLLRHRPRYACSSRVTSGDWAQHVKTITIKDN